MKEIIIMTYEYWKSAVTMKPFENVEQFDKFSEDLCKLPSINTFANTSLKKSKIKKGVNSRSEKFDSFAEYTFAQYMRLIKGFAVERNHQTQFLTYIDEKGKQRKFYPDFIVNGLYCEIKGRYSEKDICKKDQHPEVEWYFQPQINEMAAELDKNFKNWKDDFFRTN